MNFLFLRMLLAHFLADFPFQTNYIFKKKFEGIKGVIIHTLIFLLCAVLLGWPYLNQPYFYIVLLIMFTTHIIIDSWKVYFAKEKKLDNLLMFFSDQFFHVFFKMSVYLFPFSTPQVQNYISDSSFLNLFTFAYFSNDFILYLIGYTIAVFVPPILIIYIRKGTRTNQESVTAVLTLRRKIYGLIERFIIITCVIISAELMIAVLMLILIRLRMYILSGKYPEKYFGYEIDDLIISTSLAFLMGVILRYYVYLPEYVYEVL